MKVQLARLIFLSSLSVMKKILDLIAFKFDKKSDEYNYMKSQIMDYFYKELKKIFSSLESDNIIENCSCSHSLRKGYSDCKDCSGSGFRNKA